MGKEESSKEVVKDERDRCKYIVAGKSGIEAFHELLSDELLEEVMVLGYDKPVRVYHREAGSCLTNVVLSREDVDEIVSSIVGESAKNKLYIDARLPDGSRANVVLPPVALDGPAITIRKFPSTPLSILDLVLSGTLNTKAAAVLWMYVEGLNERPANMIIVGGTGTGKTTLLNSLSVFFHEDERVITIEDTAELSFVHDNWVRLEAPFGSGVTLDELLRNALRMRPDRIIVGEVRGPEAETLFNAMNTGHEGVLGTLHANSAYDALRRLSSPPMNVPKQMLRLLDVIVVMGVIRTGGRRRRMIIEISETTGGENDLPKINTLFKLDAGRLAIVETGVPSTYRDLLSERAGTSPREVSNEIRRRERFLSQLLEKKKTKFGELYECVQLYYAGRDSVCVS